MDPIAHDGLDLGGRHALAAIVQNLKTLANYVWRSPPDPGDVEAGRLQKNPAREKRKAQVLPSIATACARYPGKPQDLAGRATVRAAGRLSRPGTGFWRF